MIYYLNLIKYTLQISKLKISKNPFEPAQLSRALIPTSSFNYAVSPTVFVSDRQLQNGSWWLETGSNGKRKGS